MIQTNCPQEATSNVNCAINLKEGFSFHNIINKGGTHFKTGQLHHCKPSEEGKHRDNVIINCVVVVIILFMVLNN